MLVLGIGMSMQILTIVVQSTVAYHDLGVGTSGVTFFRTLGSSFGAAVFGAVYSNVLNDRLPAAVAASPGVDPAAVTSPQALHAYPDAQIAPIVDAYAHAIHVVFLAAIPVASPPSWSRCSSSGYRCAARPATQHPTSAKALACPRQQTPTNSCRPRSRASSETRDAPSCPR
jgi:hypothetical protein